MITALDIENFKAFGELQHVPLAPITLVFGENSSGKTSILQTLSLLKQTYESRESGAALLPRAEDGIVDLGSFNELLFDHDDTRTLRIGMEFPPISDSNRWRRLFKGAAVIKDTSLRIVFSFRRKKTGEITLCDLQLCHSLSNGTLATFETRPLKDSERSTLLRYGLRSVRAKGGSHQRLTGAACTFITRAEAVWEPMYKAWHARRADVAAALMKVPLDFHAQRGSTLFEEDKVTSDQAWLREVKDAISFYSNDFTLGQFIDRVARHALGTVIATDGFLPLAAPAHNLTELPEFELSDMHTGTAAIRDLPIVDIGQLAAMAGRLVEEVLTSLFPLGPFRSPPQRWYIFTGTSPVDVGYKGHHLPDLLFRRPKLVEQANQWLTRLQIGYQIRLKSVGDDYSDLFEVRLIDTRRREEVEVALSDVGFGISQILPFIVQTLASARQLLSIEQPEVHIHPRLQADLGDLIAEAIGPPYQHAFLIETHSEHLMLRIQKLIREKKLAPKDVSVLYVSRGPCGSSVSRLRLDEEGEFLDEWPNGFFPERLRELR